MSERHKMSFKQLHTTGGRIYYPHSSLHRPLTG